jgi:di/tricarboxylate transporter
LSTRSKLSSITLLVILILSTGILSVYPTIAQTDQTTSKLQLANTAVNQAFNAVLDAEAVGANMTRLLVQINYADSLLSQAENSYRTGDFSTAATKAESLLPIAQQIATSAQNAKQNAVISSQNAFWLTIAFTIIGIVMLIEVLFLVWLWLKRRYIKNLSEAKPEVTVNEAQ